MSALNWLLLNAFLMRKLSIHLKVFLKFVIIIFTLFLNFFFWIFKKGLSAVELFIPKLKATDGQLTVRLDWSNSSCSQEFPVHPLDVVQSLSLRLERTIYQPDQVGKCCGVIFWQFERRVID